MCIWQLCDRYNVYGWLMAGTMTSDSATFACLFIVLLTWVMLYRAVRITYASVEYFTWNIYPKRNRCAEYEIAKLLFQTKWHVQSIARDQILSNKKLLRFSSVALTAKAFLLCRSLDEFLAIGQVSLILESLTEFLRTAPTHRSFGISLQIAFVLLDELFKFLR